MLLYLKYVQIFGGIIIKNLVDVVKIKEASICLMSVLLHSGLIVKNVVFEKEKKIETFVTVRCLVSLII